MSRVRGADSLIERRLGQAMWCAGVRYRKQYRSVPGRPDFAVVWARVAIFCDSAFWHGRDWPEAAKKIKTNKEFWIPKIERNIARDKEVNKLLTNEGWWRVRFWDDQILSDAERCVRRVLNILERRRRTGFNDKTHSH